MGDGIEKKSGEEADLTRHIVARSRQLFSESRARAPVRATASQQRSGMVPMLTESCGSSSDEHVDSKQGTLRSKRTELEHVSEHLRARAPIQDSDNSWHLGKETLPLVSSDHVAGTFSHAKHVERTMSARADAPVADCGNLGHEDLCLWYLRITCLIRSATPNT